VSRATAPLWALWRWFEPVRVRAEAEEGSWTPGLLTLKGGDLKVEIADLKRRRPHLEVETTPLARLLPDWTDETKVLLSVR
jgi:16S rRNA (guanine527-N7)-methyltransferase